jgi:hypothetical protein
MRHEFDARRVERAGLGRYAQPTRFGLVIATRFLQVAQVRPASTLLCPVNDTPLPPADVARAAVMPYTSPCPRNGP